LVPVNAGYTVFPAFGCARVGSEFMELGPLHDDVTELLEFVIGVGPMNVVVGLVELVAGNAMGVTDGAAVVVKIATVGVVTAWLGEVSATVTAAA
jgi:hypothetical protein